VPPPLPHPAAPLLHELVDLAGQNLVVKTLHPLAANFEIVTENLVSNCDANLTNTIRISLMNNFRLQVKNYKNDLENLMEATAYVLDSEPIALNLETITSYLDQVNQDNVCNYKDNLKNKVVELNKIVKNAITALTEDKKGKLLKDQVDSLSLKSNTNRELINDVKSELNKITQSKTDTVVLLVKTQELMEEQIKILETMRKEYYTKKANLESIIKTL
jgi:hypothetical protein